MVLAAALLLVVIVGGTPAQRAAVARTLYERPEHTPFVQRVVFRPAEEICGWPVGCGAEARVDGSTIELQEDFPFPEIVLALMLPINTQVARCGGGEFAQPGAPRMPGVIHVTLVLPPGECPPPRSMP